MKTKPEPQGSKLKREKKMNQAANVVCDSTPVDEATRNISRAFTERGNAHFEAGEFHLAIRDYAQALLHRPDPSPFALEYNPEAYDQRQEAMWLLEAFFASKGTDPLGAKVPTGYLVVGDGNILSAAPLTQEGRQQAIEYANELARDTNLRHRLDDQYLTESHVFDAIVYRHEAGQVEEIHRAEPIDEGSTQAA